MIELANSGFIFSRSSKGIRTSISSTFPEGIDHVVFAQLFVGGRDIEHIAWLHRCTAIVDLLSNYLCRSFLPDCSPP